MPGWLRTAEWLAELREEGVIRNIGVTNFERQALATLLDAGHPESCRTRSRFSLLDRRPRKGLTDLCREAGGDAPLLRQPWREVC